LQFFNLKASVGNVYEGFQADQLRFNINKQPRQQILFLLQKSAQSGLLHSRLRHHSLSFYFSLFFGEKNTEEKTNTREHRNTETSR